MTGAGGANGSVLGRCKGTAGGLEGGPVPVTFFLVPDPLLPAPILFALLPALLRPSASIEGRTGLGPLRVDSPSTAEPSPLDESEAVEGDREWVSLDMCDAWDGVGVARVFTPLGFDPGRPSLYKPR